MVNLKTEEEIKIMIEGGRKLRGIVKKLLPIITVGTSTKIINDRAEQLIKEAGGEPSFKKVPNYHWATCLSINEQIVHTPPSQRIINQGDVLTLDIGLFFKGFHTDFATTVVIGLTNNKKNKFLDAGRQALLKAIEKARIGSRLGNISQTIKQEITSNGYFILKDLTGHGIGRDLHEDPMIPGFCDQPINKTLKIKQGLVIAIEVIYSTGSENITYESDNSWSIITVDRSLSACFEHTIAVTEIGPIILT